MDIPAILSEIRPGAKWAMLGEDKSDYANLDWRDETEIKPTQLQIEAAWLTIQDRLNDDDQAASEAEAKREAARLEIFSADLEAIKLLSPEGALIVHLIDFLGIKNS